MWTRCALSCYCDVVFQLLTSLFVDPSEARRFFSIWLSKRDGVDLNAIVWSRSHAQVMFELSQHLEAAGLVGDELLDALAALKPARAAEIYNITVPRAPDRTPKVHRLKWLVVGFAGLVAIFAVVFLAWTFGESTPDTESASSQPEERPTHEEPTRKECERHADHYANLMAKGQEGPQAEIAKSVAAEMRPELIRECVAERTKSEIECMQRAQEMEVLEACLRSK